MHNRIITTVGVEVIAYGGAIGAEVCRVVRVEESTPLGVIVAGLEVIQAGFLYTTLAAAGKNGRFSPSVSEGQTDRTSFICHSFLPSFFVGAGY